MSTSAEVACFGELLWDFFEEAKGDKELVARQFRRELGGASANVAVGLSRLGVKASAVGGVGNDKLGQALEAALSGEGVDTSGVVTVKGAPTGITFVTRAASGEPSFVPYRNGTADLALGEAQVSASHAKVRYVVVSSTSMLPPARPATAKFLAAAAKAKASIVVDLNAREHLWAGHGGEAAMRAACAELASQATIVKASNGDLAAVAGKRGMSWLEEHAKGGTWILTRGDNGAAAVGAHGQVTAPTKRVRCIDATGAGDAFLAGVLAVVVRSGAKPGTSAFADAKLWSRALEVGHILGAKAVSAAGATAGLRDLDDAKTRAEAAKRG
jgi:fructokinase